MQLEGTLKLTVCGNYEKIPLVTIKVVLENEENSGLEDETIFEYELPLNFQHDSLPSSATFYAIRGIDEL